MQWRSRTSKLTACQSCQINLGPLPNLTVIFYEFCRSRVESIHKSDSNSDGSRRYDAFSPSARPRVHLRSKPLYTARNAVEIAFVWKVFREIPSNVSVLRAFQLDPLQPLQLILFHLFMFHSARFNSLSQRGEHRIVLL